MPFSSIGAGTGGAIDALTTRREDGAYSASNEEHIVSDGGAITLPSPTNDGIVLVSQYDTNRPTIEAPSGSIEGRSSVFPTVDYPLVFVSDGSNWYVSDARNSSLSIPDRVVNQYPTDEGSGATLSDDIGAEDGTINGATWQALSDAVGGHVLSYDGVDDTTDFSSTAFDYTAKSAMTITAFLNPNDTGDFRTIALKDGGFSGDGGSDVRGWVFRIGDDDTLDWIHPGVGGVGSLSVSVNEWSFVAARYDPSAGNVTLTVNDTEETVAINTQQDDATGETARFGATATGGQYFDGEMDEITLSDTTLTDSELDDLRSRRSDV